MLFLIQYVEFNFNISQIQCLKKYIKINKVAKLFFFMICMVLAIYIYLTISLLLPLQ